MDANVSLGIAIGATLTSSLGSAFQAVENKFSSLEKKSQNLKLTKALSHKLKSYENTIQNLEKQRQEYIKLGKATDTIDVKLEIYRQKLKGAKLEAVKAGISIRDLRQETAKLGKALEDTKRKMKLGELSGKVLSTGAKLGTVATTGVMTISSVIKPAIDFESAFADVKKVVDFASKEQEKQFRKTILDMSTKIPLSAVELSQIAAQGGQLGIDVKDLPKFTELVAKMATAFDMIPEQAGEAFAKLSNVYGLSMEEAKDLANAINALGNNTAAKERDIINVLGRIGGIAKQFGLTKEHAAALADTFIALGKPPEVAATAINAMLGKLDTVASQSPAFQKAFSQILPIEDFKRLQKENPEKALLTFLHSLKQLDKETQKNLIAQMFGAEFSDDIALLIGSLDQYAKALDIISDKKKYQGALDKEFEARSKTTENNLKLLSNRLEKVAITIGSVLLPPFNRLIGIVSTGIDKFTSFLETHQTLGKVIAFGTVGVFTLVGAGLALSLAFTTAKMAGLMLSGSIKNLYTASLMAGKGFLWLGRTAILGVSKAATIARGSFTLLRGAVVLLGNAFRLTPFGMVLTGITAVGFAGYMLIKHWDKVKEYFSKFWQWIREGFSKLGVVIGKIIESSPIGIALKAGKWLIGKISGFFGEKKEKKTQKIEDKTTKKINETKENIQKVIKTQKQISVKIDFSPIKVKVEGDIKEENANSIFKQLEEKLENTLTEKIQKALKEIEFQKFRGAY